MEPSTSISLLDRIQAQEPEAWQRFVVLYTPVVYDWLRRAGLNEHDASDLVQESFAAVVTSIARFERSPNAPRFRAWLWGIVNHKLQDFFRRRKSQPQGVGGSDAQRRIDLLPEPNLDEFSPEIVGSLAHRALALMKTDFQEATWNAFWRVTIEGESPADVAESLGMTVAAVYTAKSRVLSHLRRELDGLT